MRFFIFTPLLILIIFLSNGYTQDSATWGLPEGAKIRLGKGKISAVKFSPDGSQIAVASSVGIWLYDVHTGQEIALLPGHRDGFSTSIYSAVGGTLTVNTLAFSSDGKMLASASQDGTLRLFDVTTHNERHTLIENKEAFVDFLEGIPVTALAFSSDGQTLTSLGGTAERRLKVWDVNSGCLLSDISGRKGGDPLRKDGQAHLTLKSTSDPAEYEPEDPLLAFALSSDGKVFAATRPGVRVSNRVSNAVIRLGDVRTGKLHPTLMSVQSAQHPVKGLVFSPDGTMLASVETKWSLTKNPDNTGTHTRTTRSTIRIWNVKTGDELSTVVPEQVDDQGRKPFVAFSADGKTFATANQDVAAVQLWEVSTGNLISTLTIQPSKLATPWDRQGATDLMFSPDGKTLAIATAGTYSSLQLWEVSTGKIISILAEHPRLTALPTNDTAFISLNARSMQLRAINTGEVLQDLTKTWTNLIEYAHEIGGIEAFSISSNATTIATGNKDGSLQLWNMHTGNQTSTLTGHTGNINILEFTAEGRTLASGSQDKSIRLWDTSTGTQLLTLVEHINSGKKFKYAKDTMRPSAEFVNNIVFSPDGRTLASASEFGTI